MATSSGKTVLITGASSGIGEATARRLLEDGWTVYAAARRIERMRELEERGARLVALDLTEAASVDRAVARIEEETGGLDALVNNAGYGEYGSVEEVPLDRGRRQLDVLVVGPVRLIQLVLPGMRAKGRGRIVNVTSFGSRISFPLGAWYHLAKAAVEALSDSLRLEVERFGVRVVVVQPGAVRSEWARVTYDRLEEASGRGAYAELASAVKRLGTTANDVSGIAVEPDVIARTIVMALTVRRPRPRYAVPFHSRAFLFLRWLLGSAAFDSLVRLQLRWPFLARRPFARAASGS